MIPTVNGMDANTGGQIFATPEQASPRTGIASSFAEFRRAFNQSKAKTLNQQSTVTEIQKNVSASNKVIPLAYGTTQLGGRLFALDNTDGIWTVGFLFCIGEIESFVEIWLNGQAPVDGVTVNYYTGTSSQVADPLLAAAIDEYSDDLVIRRESTAVGIAYVVLQYGPEQYDDWPTVVAEVRGKKVLNPKTGLVEFSDNPALHLADLLRSPFYGHGYIVDETSLEALQDYCDDTSPGEIRRTSYAVIDRVANTDEWVETLRAYASCFVVRRGDTIHLVADRPSASVATFTADDIVRDSMSIRKRDSSSLPTVVRISYTDTTGNEWRDRLSEPAELPGVREGLVPRRESVVSMPGINRHSQANRAAIERLNKLQLSDLDVEFLTFDRGLAHEVGDVITVTHPYGLTDKLLRLVADPEEIRPGRWRMMCLEYDPAAYSDEVAEQPSYTDGNLPSTAVITPPTDLVITETTYQLETGKYASRINIRWTPSTSIFVTGYSITVTDNMAEVVFATNTTQARVATPPLKEGVPYTIEVIPYTPLLVGSDALTGIYEVIGKTAIPDAPASLNGFEAGGEVRLNWPASTDVDAERYEIRYSLTSGNWETATVLDVVDGLRLVTRDVPEGTWRFYVKTIDSIQQYSTDTATLDLEVTLDNDAFAATAIAPLEGDFAAMVNMHESLEDRLSPYSTYYADGGDSWSSLFGSAAMSTFTDPLANYQTLSGESIYYSNELDLINDVSGNFQGSIEFDDFGNSVNAEIGVRPNSGAYDYTTQLSRQATGRYTRMRVRGSDPFLVRGRGGNHRVDVVAREETGSDTSLSSGGRVISLDRQYAAARSIVITPQASSARSAVFDNVQLDNGGVTSFDVYIFDSSGAQVATPFRWVWKGV